MIIMKKILFAFAVFMLSVVWGVAQEYKLYNPSKYLGKDVRIEAVSVAFEPFATEAGFALFRASTHTGSIFILVSEEKARSFISNAPRDGTSSKSYTGTFVKTNRGVDIVYALKMK